MRGPQSGTAKGTDSGRRGQSAVTVSNAAERLRGWAENCLENRTGRSVDNIICMAEMKTKLARLTYIFTQLKPVLTVERIQAKSQVLSLPASQVCPSPACFRVWAAGFSLQKALRTNTPSVKREIRMLFFD